MRGKKTAPNYFSNKFVRPRSILIILAYTYSDEFPTICVFQIIYIKWKIENRLKIHFVYLLADEHEYTDSHLLFVVCFKSA